MNSAKIYYIRKLIIYLYSNIACTYTKVLKIRNKHFNAIFLCFIFLI